MEYIVTKRFKDTVESGPVNLPYGTVCEARDGCICHDGRFLARQRSRLAHTSFARNDDGHGLERGRLTREIESRTAKADEATMRRVAASETCRSYRRQEHQDMWLWSHEFYNAPIEDLRHIAALVGAKGG